MDIPNEIFHEILSHLSVTDIYRVEGAFDIKIPEYLYLRIHKKKFKKSLDEIDFIDHEIGPLIGGTVLSIRKFGRTDVKRWQCVYWYNHQTPSHDINSFRTNRGLSNILITYTLNLSKSFADCIYDTAVRIYNVKQSDNGVSILLMPKGDKTGCGIDTDNEFIHSSHGIVFIENNIY